MRKCFAISTLFIAVTVVGTASMANAQSATENYTGSVQMIKVGIGSDTNNFCYLDEDGNLQGYEYETMKLVDELLPQYEFEYEPTEFKNLLVGLDTDRYDLAINHFSWSEDREEKYLYGNVGNYYDDGFNLIVGKDSGLVVETEDDLAGLTLLVQTGSDSAYQCELYNETHPDNTINLVYTDALTQQALIDLESGAIDGFFGSRFGNYYLRMYFGDTFDVTGEGLFYDPNGRNGAYILYNYGDEQLRNDIDGALQKLLDDGSLSKLSVELLGDDYTIIKE